VRDWPSRLPAPMTTLAALQMVAARRLRDRAQERPLLHRPQGAFELGWTAASAGSRTDGVAAESASGAAEAKAWQSVVVVGWLRRPLGSER